MPQSCVSALIANLEVIEIPSSGAEAILFGTPPARRMGSGSARREEKLERWRTQE